MGDYTQYQRFYLTDPDELVDHEMSLNYNWRLLDDKIKHMIGWAPTDSDYITGTEDLTIGRKYLKRQSNSLWISNGTAPVQDTYGHVDDWTAFPSSTFEPGWTGRPGFGVPRYRVNHEGEVEMRGQMWLDNGATEITLKSGRNVMTVPSAIRPTQIRYMLSHGGVAPSSQYSIFRFQIATTGIFQIVRMGGAQTSSSERYISLDGCTYALNVGT